jgi:Ala-tRNA(Pro) deacylase
LTFQDLSKIQGHGPTTNSQEVTVPVEKLKAFLDRNNVPYIQISHSKAYTAQAIAALAHVPGRELAKTVIVRVNGKLAMAVLPASFQVDLQKLRIGAGADDVQLATEYEFEESFPDCEVGAMPPFGNLYAMPVYVEQSLTRDEEIAFNAGSHKELIRLAYADFERLVNPVVLEFSRRATATAA